jgi:hypothetical protein
MKLITEVNDNLTVLREEVVDESGEKTGKKNYFIEGIFLQGGIKNKNGRVYPEAVLDKQVKEYTKNYVESNRALGELGHPDGPTINLDRVSHQITELTKDGSNYRGKAKILDTPNGRIVKNLIDEGIQIGVSSRGLGSLKKNNRGINEVQDDFHLVTAGDIVADPSAPDAFVQGIMEGKEWIMEHGILREIDPYEFIKEQQEKVDQIARQTKHDKELREQAFKHLFFEHLSKLTDS